MSLDLEGMDLADVRDLLSASLPTQILIEGCLWDDTFTDGNGRLMMCADAGKWHPIDVAVEGACEHFNTICSGCVDSWSQDWALRAVAL